MALRGTLKDFGIADIFQLIGHQGKTGVLAVRNRDQAVQIYFKDGGVVRAESSTRQKRELLGAMLVRAEVVTDAQLKEALESQQKTLKRLGDILIETGALDAKTLREFARLQTTETIYRLFLWDGGSYEFSQTEVQKDPELEALRSENVLMEGFRQVDEWPMIRRRITGYGMIFERLEDLDQLTAAAEAGRPASDDDLNLDDAFGDLDGSSSKSSDPRLKNVGQNERIVYHLVNRDRDVQKIIDLSRLGEFETCKALVTLIDAQIITALAEGHRKPSAEPAVGGILTPSRLAWLPTLTRVLLYLALISGGLWAIGYWGLTTQRDWLQSLRALTGFTDVELQNAIGRGQLSRLRRALEIYRAEKGDYPPALTALVEERLVDADDLRFPWQQPYVYVLKGDTYQLLRPVY